MSIENKVEPNLPVTKEENSLDKVMKEATLIEKWIVQTVNVYAGYIAMSNLGTMSTFDHPEQATRIRKYFFLPEDPSVNREVITYLSSLVAGAGAFLLTETVVLRSLCYLLGSPLGFSAFLGAKVFTNTIGYFHYKKQRKKHEALEKMGYLLEGKNEHY